MRETRARPGPGGVGRPRAAPGRSRRSRDGRDGGGQGEAFRFPWRESKRGSRRRRESWTMHAEHVRPARHVVKGTGFSSSQSGPRYVEDGRDRGGRTPPSYSEEQGLHNQLAEGLRSRTRAASPVVADNRSRRSARPGSARSSLRTGPIKQPVAVQESRPRGSRRRPEITPTMMAATSLPRATGATKDHQRRHEALVRDAARRTPPPPPRGSTSSRAARPPTGSEQASAAASRPLAPVRGSRALGCWPAKRPATWAPTGPLPLGPAPRPFGALGWAGKVKVPDCSIFWRE